MTRKPPTPPPDEDRIDRRTLPRERPWLSKPRPSARTGAELPGAPRAARLSDLPKLTLRVPWTTSDRLNALAELRGETLGAVLAVAVTDYLTRLNAAELVDVDRVQRTVQARRLRAGKAKR